MADAASLPGPDHDVFFSGAVRGRLSEQVLLLTIDHPPINAVNHAVRAGLAAALDVAEQNEAVRAVVLTGEDRHFACGPDIREFDLAPASPSLPEVTQRIESLAKPVVAAINGDALGGGLEIALASHFRLASQEANVGLPEVKLGGVPGAGGTQRLPRLIGLSEAAEMISSGKVLSAKQAEAIGLIDRVSTGSLVEQACQIALELSGKPLRRTGELPVAPTTEQDFDNRLRKILQRSRGQIAPAEAVRLVRAAAHQNISDGLADERNTSLALQESEQAKALRYIFFAEQAASKVPGLEGVQPASVKTVGVVGMGLMGSGIATAALGAGFSVVGIDSTPELASRGRDRVTANVSRATQGGRLTSKQQKDQLARLSSSANMQDLRDADLVIEAVFDDYDVKNRLFRELETIVRPDAVLATNTSYLDPDLIAQSLIRPERLVGMHFFSPANVMRLVEVVRCSRLSLPVLATAVSVARRLGKLPIVCGVIEGFIGNRMFSAYRQEAEYLVEDGASPYAVDAAAERFGMPMGPFAVGDLAGLEISWARRKRNIATRDTSLRYVELPDLLCEAGRFGQKTGKGWYKYQDGLRAEDPDVLALIADARARKSISPRSFTEQEIIDRLLSAIVAEGRQLIEKRVATCASDLDLVMVNGFGFPPYKGGPMYIASRA